MEVKLFLLNLLAVGIIDKIFILNQISRKNYVIS